MYRFLILLTCAALLTACSQNQDKAGVVRIDRSGSSILKGVKEPSGTDLFVSSGQVAAVAVDSLPASDYHRFGGATYAQAMSTLGKIEGILAEEQLQMRDVISMTVYLAPDPENGNVLDFDAWSEAYGAYFNNEKNPNKVARTTIGVAALARPGILVEVEVLAAYP